jgi:hypothetical protein
VAVNPLLADPPATSDSAQPSAGEQPPAGAPPQAPPATAASSNGALQLPPEPTRSCKSCGAKLDEGQEWCLQCGAGAPGSIVKETDWRPLAVLAAAGVILLAGAGTAAYAALNQQPAKPPTHLVIAQVAPPAATAPPTGSALGTTPTPTTPGATPTPTTPGTTKSGGAFGKTQGSTLGLPSSTIKPPKLPAVVPTPHTSLPTPTPSTNAGSTPTTTTPTATTPTATTPTATTPTQPQTPNPILLDTDAASNYNPSGYPVSYFGDPSLAIDGETTTAWTAQVEPKAAPLMAEGLALDLKTPTRVGSLEVLTSTPGATVEIYGANGSTLPASITDPAWTKLKGSHFMKNKKATIKLGAGSKAFRFFVLWFVKAPATSTPTAPGQVSISEAVLYPPAK